MTLDPINLPLYALRTTMRMLLAIVCSIIFTFIYAALAAKSRRAEMVLIPLLDILQSVPILGFLTFTVVFFMNLFPGSVFGAELACVFAIFTSQAWNMTFSMYQSMRNVPKDLEEASQSFHLSGWQRFWRLDVPFAMPGLIWNTMMSMSGGWFFVVASEAITVGNTTVTLPGIGSYVALAISQRNLPAIGYAILTMLLVLPGVGAVGHIRSRIDRRVTVLGGDDQQCVVVDAILLESVDDVSDRCVDKLDLFKQLIAGAAAAFL